MYIGFLIKGPCRTSKARLLGLILNVVVKTEFCMIFVMAVFIVLCRCSNQGIYLKTGILNIFRKRIDTTTSMVSCIVKSFNFPKGSG